MAKTFHFGFVTLFFTEGGRAWRKTLVLPIANQHAHNFTAPSRRLLLLILIIPAFTALIPSPFYHEYFFVIKLRAGKKGKSENKAGLLALKWAGTATD
jgi:hypothetical protein